MRCALAALLLLALTGCDDHLFPSVEGGDVSYTPDWTGTQRFMADHCEGCHPSLSPPDMPDAIAEDIVNGTGNWVIPGDPDNSELWLVLIDQSEVTALMPLGNAQPLPNDVIEPVRQWIIDGARLE